MRLIFVGVLTYILGAEAFDLTILHNNDVHAHFEEVDKYSGECSDEEAAKQECYGGEARRVTIINQYRAQVPNTLILDAGDRFTGTLWFILYRGEAASTFVNRENYDAYCLGNHEFDLGVEGLVPFLDNLTVPVLDANIDVSREPRLQGKFNRSMVLERGGVKIGIVGYITTDTAFISKAGNTVTFTSEIDAVKAEVKKLKDMGIKVIIGLSHAGYGPDKFIASEVDGLDIIVGGHSHTFLYTGDPPSTEDIEGPYPTVIKQASGRTVLVVQAYAWGKYMGLLNVTFNGEYEVESWSGNPVLLDKTIQQDADTLAIITKMKAPLAKIRQKIVGRTYVRLEGDPIQCRLRECNTGNLLTDSMVMYHVDRKTDNDTWALAAISIMNSGGIRASTEPGNISNGQILTILPFGNTVDLVDLQGKYLRQALEHSVERYDVKDRPGAFLQMSGLRVTYNLALAPGSRVVSADVRCLRCMVPTYSPLEDDVIYKVLLPSFLIDGGDGFSVIKANARNHVQLGSVDSDVLRSFLQTNNPVFAEAEGRIRLLNETDVTPTQSYSSSSVQPCGQTSGVTSNHKITFALIYLIFMSLLAIEA